MTASPCLRSCAAADREARERPREKDEARDGGRHRECERERCCDLGIRVTKLGFDLKKILEFGFSYFKLKIFF